MSNDRFFGSGAFGVQTVYHRAFRFNFFNGAGSSSFFLRDRNIDNRFFAMRQVRNRILNYYSISDRAFDDESFADRGFRRSVLSNLLSTLKN